MKQQDWQVTLQLSGAVSCLSHNIQKRAACSHNETAHKMFIRVCVRVHVHVHVVCVRACGVVVVMNEVDVHVS